MKVIDIAKHRFPMLMIDKVLEHKYMVYVVAQKNVSHNEPWVQGHYPEMPIFPGVLLIETMAQASTYMFIDETKRPEQNKYGFLTLVDRAKFIRPVYPGDVLVIHATMSEQAGDYIKIDAECKVDEKKVACCSLSYLLKEKGL